MGQQQLLLVILVTIVVGIATVVAIGTFGEAADSANMDAVRQDMAAIASAAQGYYIKPEMMDGGNRSFADITLHSVSFAGIIIEDDLGVNENGTYAIEGTPDQTLTILAYASSEPDYNRNNGTATFRAVISPQDVELEVL